MFLDKFPKLFLNQNGITNGVNIIFLLCYLHICYNKQIISKILGFNIMVEMYLKL